MVLRPGPSAAAAIAAAAILLAGPAAFAAREPLLAPSRGQLPTDTGIDGAISVAPDRRIPSLHEELRRVKGSAFEVVVAPR